MRLDEVETVELNRARHRRARPDAPGAGFARFLAGSLAAGLAVLTLALLAAELLTESRGLGGPGAGSLIAHGVGSAAAIGAAVIADRSRGRVAGLALAVVVVIVALVLWFFWLS